MINSQATPSASAVSNFSTAMMSFQQLMQTFATTSSQPSTSALRSPSPFLLPIETATPTRRNPIVEVEPLGFSHTAAVDSDIPLPVHHSIQLWKRWLSNKVIGHARQMATSVGHVSVTAPDIKTGCVMLWQYLCSALGDREAIVLSDLPGQPEMNKFPLWALFQEEDSVWSM